MASQLDSLKYKFDISLFPAHIVILWNMLHYPYPTVYLKGLPVVESEMHI